MLDKQSEELKNLVAQRDEDLACAKERMESTMSDLDSKLVAEQRNKDSLRGKADTLEKESRQLKEQLAEMARKGTEYSNMINGKEQRADRLSDELDKINAEREALLREVVELRANINTLTAELDSEQKNKTRNESTQIKLQAELDELRALLDAKVTVETRRSEVAKSKEEELADLRSQAAKLSADLTESRRVAAESQDKLKVELETITREHKNIQSSHQSLSDREQAARAQLKKVEVSLSIIAITRSVPEQGLQEQWGFV
ncbi:hypothetical protein C8Q80DRAFT_1319972 [Daedaleopsis nitida]|nr:hypothetical protein C8Q80DRAFT_1319972 [Daedaleopsis nitida]